MPTLNLGYGRASLPLEFEGGRFRVLEPEARDERPMTDAEIGAVIDDPFDSQPLEDIVSPGESALVVVSDATRSTGSAQVVNLLVRRLVQLGVAPYDLRIIFATGIHRRVTREEKTELLSPFVVQRVRTINHDPHDPAQHVSLGETERGTPVELNRALLEHSHVILTGGVGFHYFAGFTGGRKSVCPGLASARTVEATHLHALDFERGGRRAGVGAGRLDGNAVHEECERIAAEAAPSFLVNTVVDGRGRVVRAYAGDWRGAHRLACAEYADSHTVKIEEKRPLVVVSAGGAPHDLNLIQAHKALEMASHACSDGGHVVLVAECADGLGRPDFLKWFDARDSRELEGRLREAYEVNGQTAWSLLTKAERYRVHLVSNLDADDVRRMGMTPARSIEEALAEVPADAPGYVMPGGAAFMPVLSAGL
ncbi:MAG TPA: nickel-dependent lactate racemase [Pyrinomonadaceae bacterium]|jgi:nickel-dependent lactate racemase|nr:nickel-dependent lactate racemase [Pyrinomonadaceae bacterium]